MASVVPSLNGVWQSCLTKVAGMRPLVVSDRVELGVSISYPAPETIGADRLANATAAAARYGAPVIVADFGTALTFDVVSAECAYVGGVIAPGLPLMTEYLAERTALLPEIELKGRCPSVGKSTEGAMRIGAHVGYRGIVREIVTYLESRLDMKGARLCATGGFAGWVLAGLDIPLAFDRNLTLFGIGRIHELNVGRGNR
jgi:type III pantothenate kinase